MVELRHLRHFVAVAEELSFTNAARKIPIAQSALSASVHGLERRLCTQLFERTGQAVALTESGKVLLAEAQKILVAVERAKDAVAAVEGGVRGKVRIGILQSLAFEGMCDLLVDFHSRRPLIELDLWTEPAGSAELVRLVQQSRLDVAFVALPAVRGDGIEIVPLTSEPLRLAVPRDHPLSGRASIALSDLDRQSFVEYPSGWGIRQSVDRAFAEHGLQRTIAIEVADCRMAYELARGGLGLGFVIPTCVSRPDAQLHSTDPAIHFSVSLVASKSPAAPMATRAFVDVVLEHFPSRPALG